MIFGMARSDVVRSVRDARGGTIDECRLRARYVNLIRDISYSRYDHSEDRTLGPAT